jgi:hypothetical protein
MENLKSIIFWEQNNLSNKYLQLSADVN